MVETNVTQHMQPEVGRRLPNPPCYESQPMSYIPINQIVLSSSLSLIVERLVLSASVMSKSGTLE